MAVPFARLGRGRAEAGSIGGGTISARDGAAEVIPENFVNLQAIEALIARLSPATVCLLANFRRR